MRYVVSTLNIKLLSPKLTDFEIGIRRVILKQHSMNPEMILGMAKLGNMLHAAQKLKVYGVARKSERCDSCYVLLLRIRYDFLSVLYSSCNFTHFRQCARPERTQSHSVRQPLLLPHQNGKLRQVRTVRRRRMPRPALLPR